jgi:hypothetical protein
VKHYLRATGLLILLSMPVSAQVHPEMVKLMWISGCWKSEGNVQAEEHWTRLDGQSMLGMGRTIVNGKTVFTSSCKSASEQTGSTTLHN